MRTDRTTLQDTNELDMFSDGGSIEYNALTDIKISGSLPFVRLPDIGNDYVRVYSVSELDGVVEQVIHGTFIIATPSSTIQHEVRKGDADIYSLLQIVSDAGISSPLFIPAGTNAITYAKGMVEVLGLTCLADSSAHTLAAPKNYDAGTSCLEVVNDLCQAAHFANADIDPSGTVLLQRYVDPSSKAPTFVLRDDKKCVFASDVKYEFDIYAVPNVSVAVMSNEDVCLSATATNNDALSPFSVVNRGRQIVYVETFSEVESLADLTQKALDALTEKSSAIESVEIRHVYVPFQVGQCIKLEYLDARYAFTGIAVKRNMTLSPGMPCSTRLQRFERGFVPSLTTSNPSGS